MRNVAFPLMLIFGLTACAPRQTLPELYTVPDVNLETHEGDAISLGSFVGKVVIYDFIFTRCAGTCPLMSRRMRGIAEHLSSDPDLRFVSISVDPTHDTPEVLRRYKQRYSEDPRWFLLTGDRNVIVDLSVRGFKLAAGDAKEDVVEPLLHSSKFVLVDRTGMIRGYYDTFLEGDVEKLERDARQLLSN